MIIHKDKWVPVPVIMQTDGTMEHLGVTWDMSLDNVSMYEQILTQVNKHITYINASKASLDIKMCAISVSLMSSLIYDNIRV